MCQKEMTGVWVTWVYAFPNYIAKNCAFQCTYILILKIIIIKSGKCIKVWIDQEWQIVKAG